MTMLYYIDPDLIPEDEYPEWEQYLDRITNCEMPWLAYSIANNMNLFVAELHGRLDVHVSAGTANFKDTKIIDSLELLKGLALKKLIMGK